LRLTVLFCLLVLPTIVWAHKVNVFAFLEGNRIVVEGYFSKTAKAQDCVVEFYSADGKKIHQGKTDDKGIYRVDFAGLGPIKGDLKIMLIAGQGHQSEYTIPAADLPSGQSVPEKKSEAIPETGPVKTATPGQEMAEPESSKAPIPQPGIDAAALTESVRTVVREELQPLIRMVANQQRILLESQDKGPDFKEIIGGIGWIVGLCGIAGFFIGRRR